MLPLPAMQMHLFNGISYSIRKWTDGVKIESWWNIKSGREIFRERGALPWSSQLSDTHGQPTPEWDSDGFGELGILERLNFPSWLLLEPVPVLAVLGRGVRPGKHGLSGRTQGISTHPGHPPGPPRAPPGHPQPPRAALAVLGMKIRPRDPSGNGLGAG